MLLLEDKRFYVYAYLVARRFGKFIYKNIQFRYEPFYVGKGKNDRLISHLKDANNTRKETPRLARIRELSDCKLKPVIVVLKQCMSQDEAFEFEKLMISSIGRQDICEGPLLNCTSGGQGQTNRKFTALHKKRISETRIRRKIRHSAKTIEKISRKRKGQKLSENSKRNISIGLTKREQSVKDRFVFSSKGKERTNLHKEKIRASLRNAPKRKHRSTWKVIVNDSEIIVENLREWCDKNKVHYGSFKASKNYYKGMKLIKID